METKYYRSEFENMCSVPIESADCFNFPAQDWAAPPGIRTDWGPLAPTHPPAWEQPPDPATYGYGTMQEVKLHSGKKLEVDTTIIYLLL